MGSPWLAAVAAVTATLILAVIIHLLLGFPAGRLRDAASRRTVAAGYLVSLVLHAPLYLFAPAGKLSMGRPRADGDALHGLTARQREVLALMAEGRSNAAIAERLAITEKAVVRHVSHVYAALSISPHAADHRRVLAVVRYLSA